MIKPKISKDFLLNFIGFFLIFLFVLRLFSLFIGENIIHFFWLCNHAPLIIGLAILFRKSFLLTAEVSFLFVGFLSWVLDYLFKLFFNAHLFGTTAYLFPITNFFFFSITTTVHFLTFPLALIALFLIKKPEPKAWKGALIHAIILIPFSVYFGEKYNLNCFLKPCINLFPDIIFYPLLFLFSYFVLIVIPTNIFLTKLIKKD
ncbi:MAG: hypothetical protein ABIH28_02595 [archaeon]